MNGPEHYREAERLIERARGSFDDHYDDVPAVAARLAEAQVHATLALAAATISAGNVRTTVHDDGSTIADVALGAEWTAVIR